MPSRVFQAQRNKKIEDTGFVRSLHEHISLGMLCGLGVAPV
jgi:hypothetical protein